MKSAHEYSSHHGRRNIISSLSGVSSHNRSRHGSSREALSGMVEIEDKPHHRVMITTVITPGAFTAPSSVAGDNAGQGQELPTITEEGEYNHIGEQRV